MDSNFKERSLQDMTIAVKKKMRTITFFQSTYMYLKKDANNQLSISYDERSMSSLAKNNKNLIKNYFDSEVTCKGNILSSFGRHNDKRTDRQ